MAVNSEIVAFQKLAMLAIGTAKIQGKDQPIVRAASHYQAFTFLRFLGAILFEANELFVVVFQGRGVGKIEDVKTDVNLFNKYSNEFDESVKLNISQIGSFFSQKPNICDVIRNQFTFHYRHRSELSVLNQPRKNMSVDIFLEASHGNCFYPWIAEGSLIKLFDVLKYPYSTEEEFVSSFANLNDEIIKIARAFMDIFGSYILWFSRRYLNFSYDCNNEVDVHNVLPWDEVQLPYFTTSS